MGKLCSIAGKIIYRNGVFTANQGADSQKVCSLRFVGCVLILMYGTVGIAAWPAQRSCDGSLSG